MRSLSKLRKPYACLDISSILLWKPSVMPLLRVKRHRVAISVDQECNVSPSCTSCGNPAWRSW